ncbi:phosphodiester glycosidase family protein [Streptomyces sp. N50]|uniref:phosphodiester glycosidase family protein n=1 Tax=Streptomyces sp. N50 TaxID=3081765 RepID=UPI0029620876|nr:phosphodiester glycosidase family protein [Streptomyces sp. N50]WOX13238.1 phosphodiester glycosidase family protein [Streptomyces sp. N50]
MGSGRTGTLAAALLALTLMGCTATAPPSVSSGPAASPTPSGLPTGVRYRELTERLGDGEPVRLYVLDIAPDARVRVTGLHGSDLAGSETVRSMAASAGAIAAVNGTYYDISTGRDYAGYEGDPLGLYVENGRVLSEALPGRPALLLGEDAGRLTARVADTSTTGTVRAADGAHRELDGVDRVAGRVPDEIVSFTEEWGADAPSEPFGSTEVLLAADGTVLGTRTPAGGPLPRGGSSLYGIGGGATWLRAHARKGEHIAVSTRLTGAPARGTVDTALGGSAWLVRDGALDQDVARLGTGREPRTAAGVTADGTLLLVAIDGRAKGVSAGATPTEAGRLLLSLGAVDALNLDGGGSTTVVVDGELRNSPRSTDNGPVTERRVADGIAILPK